MRVSGLSMNVQTLANKAEGVMDFFRQRQQTHAPEGIPRKPLGTMKLLWADYTLIKVLRKEFPVPTACFGRSAAFERFLRKWF
jgi:hypothetical protein